MKSIALVLVLLSTLWTVLGVGAVLRATLSPRSRPPKKPRRPRAGDPLPPVSVLKPLCGADPGLEQNLESFFHQDYPSYELVFGVQDPNDPAIAVVERLRARHPDVRCKLVAHAGSGGINPKVNNLRGMLPRADHDLVLVSDSNVRAPEGYISDMVATYMADQRVGLVTNLFAGAGESTLGSALENVQLNGFCAAGAALPTLLGDALVIGKSMFFSRSRLSELGGLERVANVIAEDFVIGKMFQHAGLRVKIAKTVLENVTGAISVRAFLDRHLRWGMLRARLRPSTYLLEPLTSPLLMLPIALVALGEAGLVWTLTLLALRDVGGWIALRGLSRAWLPAVLAPVRELCMLVVWLRAPFKRHLTWRGNRVRLGAGTLAYAARARSFRLWRPRERSTDGSPFASAHVS
jgi:ceramide glucosyltransferase